MHAHLTLAAVRVAVGRAHRRGRGVAHGARAVRRAAARHARAAPRTRRSCAGILYAYVKILAFLKIGKKL